jgi:hypothetical protein
MAQVGEIPDRYGPFSHGHDMMWGSSQWGGFGMILGPIFMILILVGIVAGIIYLLSLLGAAGLNRPGFTGECFVQMSGDIIKGVHVCIESLLGFLWRDVSNGAVQAFGVVPVHPFQGFPFDPSDGFPWAEEVDDFGFEQANRAFGQRGVV